MHLMKLLNIIGGFGCTNDMYEFINDFEYDDIYNDFRKIRFVETEHVDNLECISFIIYLRVVFYSGDTKEINN